MGLTDSINIPALVVRTQLLQWDHTRVFRSRGHLPAEGVIANRTLAFIYCDAGTAKVKPPSITASVNDSIEWFGHAPVSTWQVTLAPNSCSQTPPFNQDSSVCTIVAGAPSQPAYAVHADGCSSNGTGSLKIQ